MARLANAWLWDVPIITRHCVKQLCNALSLIGDLVVSERQKGGRTKGGLSACFVVSKLTIHEGFLSPPVTEVPFEFAPTMLDLAFAYFRDVPARPTTYINMVQSEVFQRDDSEARGLALCPATFFEAYVCPYSAGMDEELEVTCPISTVSLPADEENGAVKHCLCSRICDEHSLDRTSYQTTS